MDVNIFLLDSVFFSVVKFSILIVSLFRHIDVAGNWEAQITDDGSAFDKLPSDGYTT